MTISVSYREQRATWDTWVRQEQQGNLDRLEPLDQKAQEELLDLW